MIQFSLAAITVIARGLGMLRFPQHLYLIQFTEFEMMTNPSYMTAYQPFPIFLINQRRNNVSMFFDEVRKATQRPNVPVQSGAKSIGIVSCCYDLHHINEQWAQLTTASWRAVWCKNKSLYKMLLSLDGVAYGV